MRALVASLVLVFALPLVPGCYAPRIQTCRGPITDFSGVSDVQVTDVRDSFAAFARPPDTGVSFRVRARTSSRVQCVAIRSELFSGGSLVHTLEVTVRSTTSSGMLVTSPLFHYRSGDRIVVRTLGARVEASVGTSADAGAVGTDASR